MGRLLPFLVLVDIALIVVALFDCLTAEPGRVRGLPRYGWVLIIVLLSPAGPIVWFVARRAEDRALAGVTDRVDAAGEHDRPALAPDDDPDFLRDIAVRAREAGRRSRADAERRRSEEDRRRGRRTRDDPHGRQPPAAADDDDDD